MRRPAVAAHVGAIARNGDMPTMPSTRFGIVGGGWWAEMYLRIAASLAEFEVSGMVVRRAEAGAVLEKAWGVRTFRTVEDMVSALGGELLFVVIAVPQPANAEMLKAVVDSGVPVLGQTPSGWTMDELTELHETVTAVCCICLACIWMPIRSFF